MNFDDWYRRVDNLCMAHLGLGIDDFPDWTSRAYYDDGFSPAEALAARFDVEHIDDLTPEAAMRFV